ncbi:MAG TPA: DNA repair protein RecO [Candidatus Doudnabacteria bacterium]|nr:DNA repair protein RecO [Candidatus Doudnabacteria bacterium]
MSREYKLTGFVIKSQDLGEADLLLTFFSMSEGKIRTVVKSAKKLTSRLAGRIQPAAEIEINLAGNNSLPKLIGAQVLETYSSVLDFEDSMAAVVAMQEFVNRALPDGQPNEELFELYRFSLMELAKHSELSALILARFFAQGLSALGFAPRELDAESQLESEIYFSKQEGRFSKNSSSIDDVKISPELHKLYIHLLSLDPLNSNVEMALQKQILSFLNNFISYQLERPLHAAQYFFGQNP